MKITLRNWDNIVRAEKRKAPVKSITWGTHGFDILRQFTKAETYFGVEHYHDSNVDGYTVQR